jgi:hypothetical protein
MDEPTCTCGTTIQLPEAPNQPGDIKGDSLCPACNKLWEFKFSPGGRFLNAPPTVVPT